ncbi:MAG: scramblase [Planctomycetes bacterium]|nr:scramblase [Planctomycetota bacterium]
MDAIVGDRKKILVRQTKEWGEILIGFESRNRFEVLDEDGQVLGYAAEEAGGFTAVLLRNLLGHCRAATVHVYGPGGEELGRGVKPFRFFFHRMEVFEGGRKIGAVQRRFSVLHRKFTVEDASGQEVLTLLSPFLRIWTFKLLAEGQEVGRISKRWGGLLKEMFTDADVFGVEFTHPRLPQEVKKLLLVAVFLVDFTCFENNQGRGSLLDWGSG